jgi:hypothetical protein
VLVTDLKWSLVEFSLLGIEVPIAIIIPRTYNYSSLQIDVRERKTKRPEKKKKKKKRNYCHTRNTYQSNMPHATLPESATPEEVLDELTTCAASGDRPSLENPLQKWDSIADMSWFIPNMAERLLQCRDQSLTRH